MRRSEAAKYARWSAAAALLLAGITGAFYVARSWQRLVEKKHAPPSPPVNVERQSMALTFSKVEENRTIFTVEASKSTEFRGENASLLEDVKITVFGKTGQRHDVLHTRSCRYSKEKGSIFCAGIVQIDLLSAAEAADAAAHPEQATAAGMHVETKGVSFDRASGLAKTDQPVEFRFPSGEGEAIGVEYKSDEGTLRLEHNVRVKLRPAAEAAKKSAQVPQEADIRGSQLDFGRDTRSMELLGPASAETPDGRLEAGEFQVLFDEDFRAKTLLAKPEGLEGLPKATFRSASEQMAMNANLISATFASDGWVERISASGNVHGTSESPAEKGEWKAESAELELWPKLNEPKELNLRGGVDLTMELASGGNSRELRTESLRISFGEGEVEKKTRLVRAETLAPGSLFWKEDSPAGGEGPQQTKLKADRLALDFGASGKAERLEASGNVLTERQSAGKALQTASARRGSVNLAEGGGWTEMHLDGEVRLREGERSAIAEHARFLRADQTATLTGGALVRDSTTQTTAKKLTFSQKNGDILAEGGVKSTDLSAKNSSVNLAPAPANITADQLRASSRSGRAIYTGHARLWQGESVLEADTIELSRETRSMSATGNVRAVFPQNGTGKGNGVAGKGQVLWRVSAGRLTYWDKEGRAHLEKDVVIQSAANRIRGAVVDLYFTQAGSGTSAGGPGAQSGGRQISRAVATGGVVVEQGARRATAERGEYTAADGRFVMSGGNPTIFDASSGTTTGRQLTFFLADDTIIVETENGSRTLTKHRVE
jgi:lipopolysaccharide export system protein LptA